MLLGLLAASRAPLLLAVFQFALERVHGLLLGEQSAAQLLFNGCLVIEPGAQSGQLLLQLADLCEAQLVASACHCLHLPLVAQTELPGAVPLLLDLVLRNCQLASQLFLARSLRHYLSAHSARGLLSQLVGFLRPARIFLLRGLLPPARFFFVLPSPTRRILELLSRPRHVQLPSAQLLSQRTELPHPPHLRKHVRRIHPHPHRHLR